MSGLEAPAAVAGVRLLGALAAPAGRALASKLTFRWRVSRRVCKRVDFSCRWRTYRKWLKTITAEELATPVETIHAPLAKRLDDALSAASVELASVDDHLSRALRLVELTYPAIAAALGDGDRAALSESWAQRRSALVRDLLVQLAGPSAALSSDDLASVLDRRSTARRAVRLQAFEVDASALASYFDKIEVPDVPCGAVRVLVGDFGSGKSEVAEAWHRTKIRDFLGRRDAPFPVWCSARDLPGQGLESALDQQLRPTWRDGRGASIAVDGLDETNPATAQTLFEGARLLARTYANVQVLLTSRPGILSPDASEEVGMELLTEDDALKLVELAGGKPHDTWRWTANMRATVTRPFFALAAGVMLGPGTAPSGEADLIRGLVEGALAKGTERSVVTSAATRSVLTRLAVALTRTSGDALSFGDRQIARSSRLVADGANGSVLFSLPIFQHWFAAQAILAGEVPTTEVVADAVSFNRWRWAAAVAALSAPSAGAVDDLLGTWVAGNPGAAAWVMSAAFGGHRNWRTAVDGDLDAETSGARLLRALRTWTDALGRLADAVLPPPVVNGPIGLGVTVSGHRIDVALTRSHPPADYVTEVPPGVHPLVPTPTPDWMPWISGAARQGDVWPWALVRDLIARATLAMLSRKPDLGAPDGIWIQERRFDLARRLLERGSLFHGDLPSDEVRERAERVFDRVGRDRNAKISLASSAMYSGAEFEDLVSWIDATAPVHIVSHLAAGDVPHPSSGYVWDLYSPRRLMELEVEVYGRACDGYDEALAHSFARLGWSMPGSAIAPFGVVLALLDRGPDPRDWAPGLSGMRVPMALMPELAPTASEAVWSASGRAVITQAGQDAAAGSRRYALEVIHSWLAKQQRELIGGLGWTNTVANDMSGERPASSAAANWLWDDLKSLGLGVGTFPQLR